MVQLDQDLDQDGTAKAFYAWDVYGVNLKDLDPSPPLIASPD